MKLSLSIRLAAFFLVVGLLTGCGQKGALFLPDEAEAQQNTTAQ